jgi:hypothetical protein
VGNVGRVAVGSVRLVAPYTESSSAKSRPVKQAGSGLETAENLRKSPVVFWAYAEGIRSLTMGRERLPVTRDGRNSLC